MPALVAACLNIATAVGLRSVPVTVQVALALSTGSKEEPQPQPISKKCCGGWLMVRYGNSSNRYLNSRSRWLSGVTRQPCIRQAGHLEGWGWNIAGHKIKRKLLCSCSVD